MTLAMFARRGQPSASPRPTLYTRHFGPRVFWNYIARERPTSLVNSRRISLLTMCILSTRYIAICQVRFAVRAQFRALSRAHPSAIFRPAVTIRVRDLSWTDVCVEQTTTKRYNVKGIHRQRSRCAFPGISRNIRVRIDSRKCLILFAALHQ